MRSRLRSCTSSALLGACAVLALPGCALVVRGTQQNIQVDAVSADGKALDSVECRAGDAVASASAGVSAPRLTVRRSGDDLSVRCLSQGRVVASAKVISRSDMGLISLAVGGVLSATIDVGRAFAYPGWITLVAGEERSYDRSDSADGPLAGIFVSRLGAGAPGAAALAGRRIVLGPDYYRANYSVTASQLLRPRCPPHRPRHLRRREARAGDAMRRDAARGAGRARGRLRNPPGAVHGRWRPVGAVRRSATAGSSPPPCRRPARSPGCRPRNA